ncbi:MAG TPA: glutamate racemase [Candidatus Saccharimonadales bacterium]|nr:glutamate racemase [Candidatus Saccharimonadales bacterium]
MYKIGVFDSGKGGKSVADAIKKSRPNDKVIFIDDHQNIPYGTKSPEQVLHLAVPRLRELEDRGCDVIVIACNTVTTHHISTLRKMFRTPLIGIEPMVKPAALHTKTKVIAVCATPATLASDRYKWLKHTYASGIKVLEPQCGDWAKMIENSKINYQKIHQQIEDVCNQNADVIVLGCTHYHWIEETIKKYAAGRAEVIQPETAIVKRVTTVLQQL